MPNYLVKKAIFLSIAAFLLLWPLAADASYKDVPSASPYFDAVDYLEQKEVLRGTGKNMFRPNDNIKLVELLKMAMLLNEIEAKKTNGKTPFKDVPENAWFAKYVKKALDLRIISFNPENPFLGPAAALNRAEGLRIMLELRGIGIAKTLKKDTALKFKDLKPTSYYGPLAKTIEELNIVEGNYLRPFKPLTRGEAAEFLFRIDTLAAIILPPGMEEPIMFEILQPESEFSSIERKLIDNPKFPIFLDVWKNLKEQYLNKNKLNDNELVYGAIKGMVEKLDDPYSNFQEPEIAGELTETLQGEFEGIGVIIEMIEGKVTVISPLKDTPAERAGLKANDIIIKVDNKDAEGLSLEEVSAMIQGEAGTQVRITVLRGSKEITFTITREKIKITSVQSKINDQNIAIVEIINFTQNTETEFEDALRNIVKQKPKGVVLDLRNNPGGYLDVSVDILDHFIEAGKISSKVEFANGQTKTFVSNGPAELKNYPLAILVNEGTASAGEIVAGALQDYKFGKLIGTKTFGKGTVQELTNYVDGSLLKLTVARWLTPLGRALNSKGLEPDITIDITQAQKEAGKDPQLDRAIQELNK